MTVPLSPRRPPLREPGAGVPLDRVPTAMLLVDGGGIVRAANARFAALVGWAPDAVAGRPWRSFVAPGDAGPALRAVAALQDRAQRESPDGASDGSSDGASDGSSDGVAWEMRLVRPDGSTRWVEVRATVGPADASHDASHDASAEAPSDAGLTVVALQDVDDRRRREAQGVTEAGIDRLTGVATLAAFEARVAHLVASGRPAGAAALLLVRVDGFAALEHARGPAVADATLAVLADRLRAATRGCDVVARVSTAEFALLLTGMVAPEHVRVVRERVARVSTTPVVVRGVPAQPAVRIGAASLLDVCDADALLAAARATLRAADGAGGAVHRPPDGHPSAFAGARDGDATAAAGAGVCDATSDARPDAAPVAPPNAACAAADAVPVAPNTAPNAASPDLSPAASPSAVPDAASAPASRPTAATLPRRPGRFAVEAGLRRLLAGGSEHPPAAGPADASPPADGLWLAYQPIVTLADGRPRSVEALCRWHDPVYGVVTPDTFIPVAEATGLDVALGEWVLRTACRQLAAWRARDARLGALRVNVNVSAGQLHDPGFVRTVVDAASDAGLPLDRLTLEITETGMAADPENAAARMTALQELGVRLAIDDFGTGYSSLAALARFPLQVLKVDRRFVADLAAGGRAAVLARAVLALGGELELATVAEGIETAQSAAILRALGCRYGQGWHFGRPLDGASAGAHLSRVLGAARAA